VIKATAVGLTTDAAGSIKKTSQPFVAIPYSTWANRGQGQMAVWLARTESAARPTPFPTIATASTVTTSRSTKNPQNIVDGEEPRASNDSSAYFDWWPRNGCRAGARPAPPPEAVPAEGPCSDGEWVEMTFAKAATISQSEVYWFDDTGRGGVRVPASWRLLYKDGQAWKPVDTANPFGIARDRWNTIAFKPVATSALRIELTMQPGVSAGVQEWKVR